MKTDDAIYVIKSQPKTCDVFDVVKLKFQDVSQEVAFIFPPIYTTIVVNGEKFQSHAMTLTLIGQCPMLNSSKIFSYATIYSNFKFLD